MDGLECRDLNHMILIYDRGIPSGLLIQFSGMLHPIIGLFGLEVLVKGLPISFELRLAGGGRA